MHPERRRHGARRLGPAAATIALLLVAACASGERRAGGSGAAPAGDVSIVIENVARPGVQLSVQLVSGSGERMILGAVGPQRTETFAVEDARPGISYRLVAGVAGGGDIVSEPFALSAGTQVRWRLPYNTLRVTP